MTTKTGGGLQTPPQFTGERWIPGASPKRIELDHLARYLFASKYAKGKTVLDIACGMGAGSRILYEAGAASVKGVDIDPVTVEYAKMYQSAGLSYEVGNILNPLGEYDLIVCFETIEHIADYPLALLNLAKACKETLIISSPSADYVGGHDNPFHYREFTIAELSAELEALGFKTIEQFGQRADGSPDVKPVTVTPRYFTLVATK